MLAPGRDRDHRLWAGDMLDVKTADGTALKVKHEFRFQQGLLPTHAAALDGRQDLAARLYGMALWSAPAEDLDAAVDALLKATPA